ncbi:kinase-like protein [Ceratobasidium sp. AG-I]|nr:kinase-like protein [Ceratobasidium sp. AG-I]
MDDRVSSWLRNVTPPATIQGAKTDSAMVPLDEKPQLPPLVLPGLMFQEASHDFDSFAAACEYAPLEYEAEGMESSRNRKPYTSPPVLSALSESVSEGPVSTHLPYSVPASPPSNSGSSVLSMIKSACSSIRRWTTRKRKRTSLSPARSGSELSIRSSASEDALYVSAESRVAAERKLFQRLKEKLFPKKRRIADDTEMAVADVVMSSAKSPSKKVSSTMSAVEVMTLLLESGCTDLTKDLDAEGFSNMAISGGGFADVYRGKLRNGLLVAVKCPRWLFAGAEQNRGVLKDVARELHAWSKCKHIYILDLLGMAGFRNQVAMVSPWMANGTMPQYFSANPEANRLEVCSQITLAIEYLHDINLVHGDIKGANVLISEKGEAKLGDFGNSILKHQTMQFSGASYVPSYSLRWAAPELLKGEARSSKAADVWALGMTILEAFTGSPPYAGKSDYAVMYLVSIKMEIPSRPGEMTEPLWSLISKCWRVNPKVRPDAWEIAALLLHVGKQK